VTGGINIGFNAGNEALAGADPSVRLVYSGPLAAPNVETDVAGITGFLSLRAFERERRRVEALQASVLEKQRLRREAALYSFKASERQVAKDKAEAEERARLAEEARLKAAAEAEKLKAEAAAKAAEEERRKTPPTPSLTIPPTEEVIRQYSPPPAGTATP
jgi:multidrug efflux pump subunit AcrA (membrane-fusion protein)